MLNRAFILRLQPNPLDVLGLDGFVGAHSDPAVLRPGRCVFLLDSCSLFFGLRVFQVLSLSNERVAVLIL